MNSIINKSWDPGYYLTPTGLTVYGAIKIYDTYESLMTLKYPSRFAWVKDASGDKTVTKGSALYVYREGKYVKIYETECMDQPGGGGGSHECVITIEEWERLVDAVTTNAVNIQSNSVNINAINQTINQINGKFVNYVLKSTYTEAIAAISENVMNNADNIASVTARFEEHLANHPSGGTDLTPVLERLTAAESALVNQESAISVINEAITTHGTSISALSTSLNNLSAKHDEDVQTISGRIDTVVLSVEGLTTSVGSLDTRLGNLTSAHNTLSQKVDGYDATIAGVQQSITVVAQDVASIGGRMNTVELTVAGYQSAFTAINNSLQGLEGRVSSIEAYLNGTSEALTQVEALI